MTSGTLYIVATPVGNLEDITIRALNVLKAVDLIACEDTRQTVKLLNHYDIKKKLVSYHKFNEAKAGEELIEDLKEGKDVALVSDAGYPLISDPGSFLIARLIEEGIPHTVIPGAGALLPALIQSGFDLSRFCFFGFPPKKKGKALYYDELCSQSFTCCFYDSPHHLIRSLEEIEKRDPTRRISVSRELTKIHEETLHGSARELIEHFREREPKGEFVVVLDKSAPKRSELPIIDQIGELRASGMSEKEAIKAVAKANGLKKRDVYDISKGLKNE